MTLDDPAVLNRQAAYVDALRAMGRPIRSASWAALIVGLAVFFWARTHPGSASWLNIIGLVLLAAGWLGRVYIIVQRSRWVRAHPFDPNL